MTIIKFVKKIKTFIFGFPKKAHLHDCHTGFFLYEEKTARPFACKINWESRNKFKYKKFGV